MIYTRRTCSRHTVKSPIRETDSHLEPVHGRTKQRVVTARSPLERQSRRAQLAAAPFVFHGDIFTSRPSPRYRRPRTRGVAFLCKICKRFLTGVGTAAACASAMSTHRPALLAPDLTSQRTGWMCKRKCVKPWSIASSFLPFPAFSTARSGKHHSPPHTPGEGRRSSRIFL